MLSCRYAIRSIDLKHINEYSALTVSNEKGEVTIDSVSFSAEAIKGIPIITKMNTLLFQALEELVWEEKHGFGENHHHPAPSHGISDRFLNDLVIVSWPEEYNSVYFIPACW